MSSRRTPAHIRTQVVVKLTWNGRAVCTLGCQRRPLVDSCVGPLRAHGCRSQLIFLILAGLYCVTARPKQLIAGRQHDKERACDSEASHHVNAVVCRVVIPVNLIGDLLRSGRAVEIQHRGAEKRELYACARVGVCACWCGRVFQYHARVRAAGRIIRS